MPPDGQQRLQMRRANRLEQPPDHPEPSAQARAVARNLAVDVITAEVTTALSMADVPCLLLKGPSTARWLYDDDDRRSYSDCDLLVPPTGIRRAEEVLGQIGFSRESEGAIPNDVPRHSHGWERTRDGGAVDLHETLPFVQVSPERGWATLSEDAETMTVAGASVRVLRPPARVFHVAIHAAQHGSSFKQPVSDLDRALKRVPLELWEEGARVAHALGAVEAFATGLRLLPEGRRLAERLRLPEGAPAEVRLRSGPQATPTAVAIDWVARLPGNKERFLFLLRKAFPPPDLIRGWFGPASTSSWGLFVGYMWRPLWLAVKVPRGLLAWRRAGAIGARGERDSAKRK